MRVTGQDEAQTLSLQRRRGRKVTKLQEESNLPEYLEGHEVQGLLDLAPHDECHLLMLIQWRAGLRISEALALQARDVQLDTDRPTLRIRRGKGHKARLVPVHPDLAASLRVHLNYGAACRRRKRQDARFVEVTRKQASIWIKEAGGRASTPVSPQGGA